jgi:O-antigen/teichoic acid export membrane protein
MQWCVPALIFYSLVQIYTAVLTAAGHIKALSYITFIAVVINIVTNILLIPSLGAKGSCLAALSSQAFCGIAAMWYAKRRLNTLIHPRSLLIYIFIAGLICGFLYVSRDWITNHWMIMVLTGMIALVMLWITKLIDLKNWRSVFR